MEWASAKIYLFQPYCDSLLAYIRPMSPIPMIPSSMFAFCHSMSNWSMLIIAAWQRSCCHGAGMGEIVFWGKSWEKNFMDKQSVTWVVQAIYVFWSLINHLSQIKAKNTFWFIPKSSKYQLNMNAINTSSEEIWNEALSLSLASTKCRVDTAYIFIVTLAKSKSALSLSTKLVPAYFLHLQPWRSLTWSLNLQHRRVGPTKTLFAGSSLLLVALAFL